MISTVSPSLFSPIEKAQGRSTTDEQPSVSFPPSSAPTADSSSPTSGAAGGGESATQVKGDTPPPGEEGIAPEISGKDLWILGTFQPPTPELAAKFQSLNSHDQEVFRSRYFAFMGATLKMLRLVQKAKWTSGIGYLYGEVRSHFQYLYHQITARIYNGTLQIMSKFRLGSSWTRDLPPLPLPETGPSVKNLLNYKEWGVLGEETLVGTVRGLEKQLWEQMPMVIKSSELSVFATLGITAAAAAMIPKKDGTLGATGLGGMTSLGLAFGYNFETKALITQVIKLNLTGASTTPEAPLIHSLGFGDALVGLVVGSPPTEQGNRMKKIRAQTDWIAYAPFFTATTPDMFVGASSIPPTPAPGWFTNLSYRPLIEIRIRPFFKGIQLDWMPLSDLIPHEGFRSSVQSIIEKIRGLAKTLPSLVSRIRSESEKESSNDSELTDGSKGPKASRASPPPPPSPLAFSEGGGGSKVSCNVVISP